MKEGEEKPRGLNILCIDGGGVRGLASLLLLAEIMRRLEGMEGSSKPFNPTDHFDVIAGTGTGGLLASMLGRLGLSVEQAISAYVRLADNVFPNKKVVGVTGSSEYKGTKLREALKSMVRDATGNEDERMKGEGIGTNGCKTMVMAMSKHNMNTGIPTIFRSYKATTNPGPDCTVWEALCATMAHPDLFERIEISDGPIRHSFIGGERGYSNPIAHVLAEALSLYPGRHVSCILSIGAGHAHTIHIADPSPSQRLLGTQALRTMQDMATDSERVAEEMAARFQHMPGVYYRLNVDQGTQDIGDHQEKLNEVAAQTRVYTERAETSQVIQQATQAIKNRKLAISVTCIDGSVQPSLAEQTIIVKRCPAPTSVFTGSEDQIQQVGTCIATTAHERRVCVIHGRGGVGKTQLALKTLEQNRDSWTHILYVDASSKETTENTLGDFAKSRGIGATYSATLRWLGSCREPWLVVFDNANHPSLNIHEYFPSGQHGNILITTRLPGLAVHARGPGSVCYLSSMSEEDGWALFLKVARIQGQNIVGGEAGAAHALLKDFGYLPLAIIHAGAYIAHSPRMTLSKYRELFLAQRHRTLEQYSTLKLKLDEYGKSVYTTWKMCYDLMGTDGDAQRMYWLTAYIHHDGISGEMFRRAAMNIPYYEPKLPENEIEEEARGYMRDYLGKFIDSGRGWDTLRFSRAIDILLSYSLIDFDWVNQTYSIQSLVQDWVVRTTIPQAQDFALECATILLSQSVNGVSTVESGTFRRKLVMHVDRVLSERRGVIGANHIHSLARIYEANGRWLQQEHLDMHSKQAREKELGREHPDTLSSMAALASTYLKQGRLDESELLQVQVLDARKRVLGEEHLDTLGCMASLIVTYRGRSQWDKAELLGLQVLDAYRRLLGEDHPRTLTSMDDLAFTYHSQGRWDTAEMIQVQVLDARKRVLGEIHPDTLSSMRGLVASYLKQGRLDKAELLGVQVIEASRRALGEEHPYTLINMGNLSSTYHRQSRWDEAERLGVQALDACKRVLGEEHPNTVNVMANLAATYQSQCQWDKAELLGTPALRGRKQILGEEHPATLISMVDLAATYWNQGRWEEAESLQVQVLNTRKRLLGDEHLDTLIVMGNLAVTYLSQRRWDEGGLLQKQVVDIRKRIFGEDHPETLISMGNLAVMYQKQGRLDEAELLGLKVLDARKRILGDEHPLTLTSMADLASTYSHQGQSDKAEQLEMQAIDTRKRVLGEDHPDTLISMGNLAATYLNQCRWDKAGLLGARVLDARKRVLGKDHPDTLIGMNNLAHTYWGQGRLVEAEALLVEVVVARHRTVGDWHPDTLQARHTLAVFRHQRGYTTREFLARFSPFFFPIAIAFSAYKYISR